MTIFPLYSYRILSSLIGTGREENPKMFTFGRLRRLVLRTSAESGSTPPGPAWCGKGAPPGSPLGDDLSFFFTSIGPVAEAEGPDCESEDGALSPPAAAAEDEEEDEIFIAGNLNQKLQPILEFLTSWQRAPCGTVTTTLRRSIY